MTEPTDDWTPLRTRLAAGVGTDSLALLGLTPDRVTVVRDR